MGWADGCYLSAHPSEALVFSPNMFPVIQTQPKGGPNGLGKLAQLCQMIISLSLGACDDWEVIWMSHTKGLLRLKWLLIFIKLCKSHSSRPRHHEQKCIMVRAGRQDDPEAQAGPHLPGLGVPTAEQERSGLWSTNWPPPETRPWQRALWLPWFSEATRMNWNALD